MEKEVGTCGNCGGRVMLPTIWHSVVPPVPTCSSCGARAKQRGPVIEMEPSSGAVEQPGGGRVQRQWER